MSDFADLCESLGLDPSDPDTIDNIISYCATGESEISNDCIYTADSVELSDDIIPLSQCDDPSECADCDGDECEWD
jgi:hypothetical protein